MIIFYAGLQATKVRAVWIACMILLACAIVGTIALAMTGPAEGTGGGSVIGLGVSLSVFLGVATAGMSLYAHCYVESLELSDAPPRLVIATVGLRGERVRRFNLEDVDGARYSAGEMRTIKAPWWTLRLHNSNLPLVLDGQGFVAEPKMFDAILTGMIGTQPHTPQTPGNRRRRR